MVGFDLISLLVRDERSAVNKIAIASYLRCAAVLWQACMPAVPHPGGTVPLYHAVTLMAGMCVVVLYGLWGCALVLSQQQGHVNETAVPAGRTFTNLRDP